MGRVGNDWGPGGARSDEMGALPEKRIERLSGMEMPKSNFPISTAEIKERILTIIDQSGDHRKHFTVRYSGTQCNTTVYGFSIPDIGFIRVDLVHDEKTEGVIVE